MVEDKFILISMEDNRTKKISEVLGNKSCKNILDYLTKVDEASVKEVSDSLNIPINTAEYNIKKLLESELIQKRKNFFWSKKGKKIVMYELSNKSIVISPKKSEISSKLKALFPAVMLSAVGAFGVYVFSSIRNGANFLIQKSEIVFYGAGGIMEAALEGSSDFIGSVPSDLLSGPPSPSWLWFLGGALVALLVVSIVNWKKL